VLFSVGTRGNAVPTPFLPKLCLLVYFIWSLQLQLNVHSVINTSEAKVGLCSNIVWHAISFKFQETEGCR